MPIRVSGSPSPGGPLPDAPPPARHPQAGRQRRRGILVATGLGILLLAGIVGWASVPAPKSSAARLSPPPVDWASVLTKLDMARAAAFAQPGGSLLALVDAPSSSAYRYDASAAEALRRRGARAVGLRMVLGSIAVVAEADRRLTLAVTDRRLPYELRDARGRLLLRVAGRGSARHLIELRAVSWRGRLQWRIALVSELHHPAAATGG